MKFLVSVLVLLGVGTAATLLALLMGLVRIYVFSYLYLWFLVPLGAPYIPFVPFLLATYALTFFFSSASKQPEQTENDKANPSAVLVGHLIGYALTLGIGWVLHTFLV